MKINEETVNCLQVLQEECAELIKVISKIQRFGFDSYHPRDEEKKTNIVKLAEEYGDIKGSIDKLDELFFSNNFKESDKFFDIVDKYQENKPSKIDKYFQISQDIKNAV